MIRITMDRNPEQANRAGRNRTEWKELWKLSTHRLDTPSCKQSFGAMAVSYKNVIKQLIRNERISNRFLFHFL